MFVVLSSEVFSEWFDGLRDRTAKLRIAARIERAKNGNFGDHKSVGDGVSEMRLTYGPGYRIYYAQKGEITYLLLNGGDKSTQENDIARAKAMWEQIKQEQNNEI